MTTTTPTFQVGIGSQHAKPDDGDFSHPAFAGMPNIYDIDKIAKQLSEDAGIEWPDKDIVPGPIQVVPSNAITTPPTSPTPPSPPPTIPPPPEPPATVSINGRTVSADQATALLQWYDYLSNNPEKAQEIVRVIDPNTQPQPQPVLSPQPTLTAQPPVQPQPVPPPAELQLPDGFDPDDPVHKFMLTQFTNISNNLSQLQQSQQSQMQNLVSAKAASDFESALAKFKTAHPEFDDNDINQVRLTASSLNIVGGLVETHSGNEAEGLYKAMEISMYQTPSVRDKVIAKLSNPTPSSQPPPTQSQTDTRRQQSLSALSGSSGSTAPRVTPTPRLDSDHAMKQELAKAFGPFFANR